MFNRKNLKEGDEVAYRETKQAVACKAIVIGFTKNKIKLSVNPKYNVYFPSLDNIPDDWENVEVPDYRVVNYWEEYERRIRKKQKEIQARRERLNRITAKAKAIEDELNHMGINYRYTLNEFSMSVDDMEKLLGIKCSPQTVH